MVPACSLCFSDRACENPVSAARLRATQEPVEVWLLFLKIEKSRINKISLILKGVGQYEAIL